MGVTTSKKRAKRKSTSKKSSSKKVTSKKTSASVASSVKKASKRTPKRAKKAVPKKRAIKDETLDIETRENPLSVPVKQVHEPYPSSLRILIYYILILGMFNFAYLLFGASFSTSFVFGNVLQGAISKFFNLIFLMTITLVVYGLYHRQHWAWDVSLFILSFNIVDSVVSYFLIKDYPLILSSLTLILSSLVIYINIVSLWLLYKKRDYFKNKAYVKDHFDHTYIVTMFVMLILIIATFFGGAFFFFKETTAITGNLVDELSSRTLLETELVCDSKIESTQKDLCYLVGVMYNENSDKSVLNSYCSKISSNLYRFACMRAIE